MTEALFAEFETPTYEDWVAAARASLRGKSLESLVTRSYEGIDIDPLPHAERAADIMPRQYRYARGAGQRARPWLIANEIDIAEPGEFNAALQEALANGQTAITISDSLRLEQADDVRTALADIALERFPIFARSSGRAPEIYQLMLQALNKSDLRRLRGSVGYDPLGAAVVSGSMPADAFDALASHLQRVGAGSPQLGSISVDTSPYHAAGAHAVQELAIALATGVAYLRALGKHGLNAQMVACKMQVFMGIGENFFIEVAKFRAIRSLWGQVLRAFSVSTPDQRLRLQARSGLRNKTRRDCHVNLLRLTSEALAAALGGVDGISLPAFDAPLGTSDAFSRRLSRNLQLILQEEAQLTRLIDPAGGAWHIEALTEQLARRAWARFQDIEAQGGMSAVLQTGAIQAEIAAVAEQRRHDLASGDAIQVGANAFVNDAESLPATPEPTAAVSEEAVTGAISIKPLRTLRMAEAFENPQSEPGADV